MLTLAGSIILSGAAGATVVTFQSGVGGCEPMTNTEPFTTQCAGDNVVGTTFDYYSVDNRDTFDNQGIASRGKPGRILFPIPVFNLSMDYLLIPEITAVFQIFNATHTLIGSFIAPTTSTIVNASFDWGPTSGIAELDFLAETTGFAAISTLRFNVPEPPMIPFLALALCGVVVAGRRRLRVRGH